MVLCSSLRVFLLKPSWFVGQTFVVFWSNLRVFLVKPSPDGQNVVKGFHGQTSWFYGQTRDFQVRSGIWFEGGVGIRE